MKYLYDYVFRRDSGASGDDDDDDDEEDDMDQTTEAEPGWSNTFSTQRRGEVPVFQPRRPPGLYPGVELNAENPIQFFNLFLTNELIELV